MNKVALYWLCYCMRLQCITGSNFIGCRKLLVCEIWTEEILGVSALGCHHCLGSFIKTLHWCPNLKSLGFFFVNGTNEISASKIITVVIIFSLFFLGSWHLAYYKPNEFKELLVLYLCAQHLTYIKIMKQKINQTFGFLSDTYLEFLSEPVFWTSKFTENED